ncbi:MAG: CaiB/BaiF CoA transferase family protein, partial [Dehalococcoidia bacterium]
YNAVNRNKRGLGLNLIEPDGKALFCQLVTGADLLLENFTPRVMENFGLGPAALHSLRPDLITVSFSGYGATGPYRDFKANGATIETIAGWTALFGYPNEGPMSLGEMEADPLSGLQMAALTLVALEHRARSGEGQHIDGSMFEAAAGYIGEQLVQADVAGAVTQPRGNRDAGMAPQGVFPCAGDDQWIAISVRHDADWQALCSVAAGAPELGDDRFLTLAGRLQAQPELEAAIGAWTSSRPARELMLQLQSAGVPAGVVLKTDEVPRDPHFVQRGWFKPMTHPDTGSHLYNGFPWRFSRSDLVCRLPPPRVGEHSALLLHDLLGISPELYVELSAKGVTGSVLQWPEAGATDD